MLSLMKLDLKPDQIERLRRIKPPRRIATRRAAREPDELAFWRAS